MRKVIQDLKQQETKLERLEIQGKIASGGYGVVHKGGEGRGSRSRGRSKGGSRGRFRGRSHRAATAYCINVYGGCAYKWGGHGVVHTGGVATGWGVHRGGVADRKSVV